MIHAGNPAGDPIAALSSVAVLADMLVFAGLVLAGSRLSAAAPAAAE